MSDKIVPDKYKTAAINNAKTESKEDAVDRVAWDAAEISNDKAMRDLAEQDARNRAENENLKAQLKNLENGRDSLFGASTEQDRMNAKKKIQKSEASKLAEQDIKEADANLSTAKKNYESTLEENLTQLNEITEEEAATIAHNYATQLASHDPNTEEGRKALLEDQKNYEDIVNNSEAYEAWISNYNSALFLTAISQGLGSAFGVPGIDFTKHPSIEQAKSNLDRLKNAYEGEKKKKGELEDKIVETKNAGVSKVASNKKEYLDKANELAKGLVDDARATKDSTELARNMTDMAAYGQFRDDEYMLDSYDASVERSKRDSRNEARTGKSIGESAALVAGEAASGVAKVLPSLITK